MSLPYTFQGGEEGDAGVIVVQVGKPMVTTEGEEVVVAFGLIALQTAWHGTSLWFGPNVTM
jgi:hypothetical protein